ncbi:MAG: hypothetical protein AAGC88_11350 [Bacteroidota bacterium]
MKAKEIRDLIDFISESGLEEVNIETEEFKIKVKRNAEMPAGTVVTAAAPVAQPAPVAAPAPVATQAPAPAATPSSGDAEDSKYVTVKSPMIGTFYRSSNPESDPFGAARGASAGNRDSGPSPARPPARSNVRRTPVA